jgi:aspartate carbamoyltransferase catalytic subunit
VLTLRQHRGPSLDGLRVAIVGDIAHSRVARSATKALDMLGAEVTLVAPPTLLPASLDGWPVTVSYDLDDVISEVDVVMLLRIQLERQQAALFPTLREYTTRYGLTAARASRLKPDALVMHPGPMNRGIEVAAEVADGPLSVVTEQVTNGVAVRMAVLYTLLGSGAPVA